MASMDVDQKLTMSLDDLIAKQRKPEKKGPARSNGHPGSKAPPRQLRRPGAEPGLQGRAPKTLGAKTLPFSPKFSGGVQKAQHRERTRPHSSQPSAGHQPQPLRDSRQGSNSRSGYRRSDPPLRNVTITFQNKGRGKPAQQRAQHVGGAPLTLRGGGAPLTQQSGREEQTSLPAPAPRMLNQPSAPYTTGPLAFSRRGDRGALPQLTADFAHSGGLRRNKHGVVIPA